MERMLQAWTAAAVTDEADRLLGQCRMDEWKSCICAAMQAAEKIRPHPLDPHIAAERERYHSAHRPIEGPWQLSTNRITEGKISRAVVEGLLNVRLGIPPTYAARRAAKELTETHHRDSIEMKIYHYCRLAGLMPEG